MLPIIVTFIVGLILLWGATKLMAAWELPPPLQTTVYTVLVVLLAVWFIYQIAGFIPSFTHRLT